MIMINLVTISAKETKTEPVKFSSVFSKLKLSILHCDEMAFSLPAPH